jgi:hypothetical protein
MTVPSREEAARLLLSLDPPAWHLRHSRVVGEVAGWLARQISLAHPEQPIDRSLVESAALLHDLDKALPKAQRGLGVRHGEAGARWLRDHGHAELAQAVSLHPVTLLVTNAGAAALDAAPLEAKLVAYADKRGRQRLVSMADRFARWTRRHPRGWNGEVRAMTWARARRLESEICELAGCRPEDVRRLPWTAPALVRAAR